MACDAVKVLWSSVAAALVVPRCVPHCVVPQLLSPVVSAYLPSGCVARGPPDESLLFDAARTPAQFVVSSSVDLDAAGGARALEALCSHGGGLESLTVVRGATLPTFPLTQCPLLRRLVLSECTADADALSTIGHCPSLEYLGLRRCSAVSGSSIDALRRSLCGNTFASLAVVFRLDTPPGSISSCMRAIKGMALLSLEVVLSGSHTPDEDIAVVVSTVSSLVTLTDLTLKELGPRGTRLDLQHHTALRRLALSSSRLDSLILPQTLLSLAFRGCSVADGLVSTVCRKLPDLQELRHDFCPPSRGLGAAGFATIAALPRLRTLSLLGRHTVTADDLALLEGSPSLERLSMQCADVDPDEHPRLFDILDDGESS